MRDDRPTTLAVPLLAAALALTCLGGAACGDSNADRNEVTDLRLLAIASDPPQALPGNTVTLSALVVDPTDTPYTRRWTACPTPIVPLFFGGGAGDGGNDADDPIECPEPLIELGDGETAELSIPEDFLERAAAEIPDELPAEVAPLLLQLTGAWLQVGLSVDNGDKRIDGFKRVVVSAASPPNTPPNPPVLWLSAFDEAEEDIPATAPPPTDGSCLAEGSPDKTIGRERVRLTPLNVPNPGESYPVLTFEGELETREENYHYSWFSAGKGLSDGRTRGDVPAAAFQVGETDEARLVELEGGGQGISLWLVVRDGRGGTDWCHSVIPFTPE